MKINQEKIKKALDSAHKEAGHNAYFGNGFRMGVEFALKEVQAQQEKMLHTFFLHGMESVNCDNCGDKGTEFSFDELYQNFLKS